MVVKQNMKLVFFISVITMVLCWEILYFSLGEGFIMGLSICTSFYFLKGWYVKTAHVTRFFNQPKRRAYLYGLPAIPILLYLYTLRTVASWDVVGEMAYIIMYLFLGIAWLALSFDGMLLLWSFSYEDDVLMSKNKAALILMTGAIVGSSLIYAGANIGDGPGWWTVVFAGGLGTVSWLVLGMLINQTTTIIESITMEYDTNSAIRFSTYLAASGVILARASSGDWTSFSMTVKEFMVGWPVLPLAGLVILIERFIFKPQTTNTDEGNTKIMSIGVSVCYILYAIVTFTLLMPRV
ncbi:hypothetical protein [Enterococcus termitis]|uniref:Uncharacterized protein n=1 Tax=Enterococcus termitis TaxID=332950 RepID=A0A1E5GHZ5_9ENTE|nr:hypothetical protein [Enterococcus termitis]OEG12287.1 hypothetical protein BCR25_07015 [Enterococcus termitis]OJG98898.1 hypothetical protein RV18_GL002760 [Enterococcus termitis]